MSFYDQFQSLSIGNEAEGEMVEREKLIISLDFGTTFSGVGYAFTTDPEQVSCIDMWPGATESRKFKTPTIMKYDEGSNTQFQWGYEIDSTISEKIEGFKLLLDPEQERPIYTMDNTEAEIQKLGISVIEVATDYMRAIFQYSLKRIQESFMDGYLESYEKQFVLSVPAVWSDKAKDTTQRAARNAGIYPIELIKEPEAAALYTLHFHQNRGLQVGDAIVICDAGGGTVDLISYEIQKLNPLKLGEITKCSGGLSGSMMLNRRFEQWIQTQVGDADYSELRKKPGYRSAMEQFENSIKPGFRSHNDADKFVSFPMTQLRDDWTRGIQGNSMTVTGNTLYNIFDPLVRDINQLVAEQVYQVRLKRYNEQHPNGNIVKAIFMVGGFGSSVYLKEFVQRSHSDIRVYQPPDAWAAIVKGAVMSKLPMEPTVTSNIASKHYGTICDAVTERRRDFGRETFIDRWDRSERCSIMKWFIHKDDELIRDKKIKLSFYRRFDGSVPSQEDLEFEDELFESDALLAPTHPEDNRPQQDPGHHFVRKTRQGDGAPYSELHYNLIVEVRSGPMKFSLEVDGEQYSAVNADY